MARALRVALIQSGRIVEDRTFTGHAKITLGSDERCTFLVPLAGLPSSTPLFELGRHGAHLLFDDRREGRVALEGAEAPLASLTARAEKRGALLALPLTETAKGRLTLGEVSVLFQFVEPPKAPVPAPLPKGAKGLVGQLDRSFMVVLGLSLAAHFAGAGWISAQPAVVEPDLAIEDFQPDRFARAMVPPRQPEVTKPPEDLTKPASPTDAPKQVAARPRVAPSAASVKERVRGMGVLGIIGSKGNGESGLGDLLKDSGVNDVTAALRGASNGLSVATVDDATAGRRKGADQGVTTTIETIGTEGVQQVELGEKGVATVTGRVQSEAVQLDTPDIDERALTRWLNQRKPAVQSCYERELKRTPTLQGRMVIRFAVDSRGRVARVGFEDDTLHNVAVQQCISTVMRAWVLPFQPEDEVPVALPFIFTAGR